MMKCLWHPKREAIALLNKEFKRTNETGETEKTSVQLGACDECYTKWREEKTKEGYK